MFEGKFYHLYRTTRKYNRFFNCQIDFFQKGGGFLRKISENCFRWRGILFCTLYSKVRHEYSVSSVSQQVGKKVNPTFLCSVSAIAKVIVSVA